MGNQETARYFQRFGFCDRQIAVAPEPDLGMVVVIPCCNEPDLIGSLESLWLCARPSCSVEVIVVVNSSAGCAEEIHRQNQASVKVAAEWIARHRDPRLDFRTLHFPELPAKQAGVGLARKIGMDEALRRLDDAGRIEGILVGYDADCRCEANYLIALERHFQENPEGAGCGIYFEHPLTGPLPPPVYDAVAAYELHLRYHVQALRHAGFPHAHHTVGSCMAVRASAYRDQGGMNRRKAGEDFYFLHKIIPLGGFGDLTATTVYPSPRPSDRVPFGTGKAVREMLSGHPFRTYPFEAFGDLKQLIERVPALYRPGPAGQPDVFSGLPLAAREFLAEQRFPEVLAEIRQNTSSEAAFHKRFFRWFDGFRAMKFLHHARDRFYGEGLVEEQAARLLRSLNPGRTRGSNRSELLDLYRGLDRLGGTAPLGAGTSQVLETPQRK